jgi:outer membrane protein assembly factor BamB
VKKLLFVLAMVVLIGVAAAVAFVLYRQHQSRNVRGSSTEEFVTTEAKPRSVEGRKVTWPMFGFDAARRRSPAGIRVRPPYRVRWFVKARALVEFPPAIAYGRLYYANASGTVFALGLRKVRVRWKFRARRCTAASPAVARGLVYMTFLNRPPCRATRSGIDGLLVALDAHTGRVRWRRRIGPSESSPLLAGRRVYVGDWNGRVYAFTAKRGRLAWTFKTGGQVKGALALAGRRLYVGSYDHHVYALDALTGRLLWRAEAQQRLGPRGRFYSTPAVAYRRVYIGGTDGKMYSYGAASGKLRWSHGTGGYVYASPAVWRRRVFVGSYSKIFYCFDAATGDVRWRYRANGPISGSAVVLNGVVYFSTLHGRTYALNATTGKLLWYFRRGSYAVGVADRERLYLLGYSRVYAMDKPGRR